jgi:hypothetical protein
MYHITLSICRVDRSEQYLVEAYDISPLLIVSYIFILDESLQGYASWEESEQRGDYLGYYRRATTAAISSSLYI